MHQNYHFIVMFSQMRLHVSAQQREHTRSSQAIVGIHYRKNNGISSEVAPISDFALWM
jgi:hypothetical protein